MLKSKWLEGKRNRRADHLVSILIKDVIPEFVCRYNGQNLGFHGSDLGKKRREELLARTPEMNAESIRSVGDNGFYVRSVTDPSREYLVDLSKQSCDCPDWPRVWLCKHVTAVAHFFGRKDQQIEVELIIPKSTAPAPAPSSREESPGEHSDASAASASILQNVINVSRDFLNNVPGSQGTARSLRMVEAHLTAVVRNARTLENPLPDQESILPNQGTWSETAKRMGATRRRKRPRLALPNPPEALAPARIGDLNCKQPRVKFTDPYSGGVRSGRNALPDARTAVQNTEERARAATAAMPQPSSSTPSSSAPLPTSAPPMWYPVPPAYPSSHTPYYPAPVYWPYGYFPPPSQYPK